jgi:hypothetical protein
MIKCVCINDKNKPKEIPSSKWVKFGDQYNVIYTVTVMPQKKLAFHLAEIDLDESCNPYEYFLANRFAFAQEDIEKLSELIQDCSEINFSMDELMKETKLIDKCKI